MKNQSILNQSALIGVMLMTFPALFWVAFSLYVFNKPAFFEAIFVPIDKISPLFTGLLLVVFPSFAVLINLFSVLGFKWVNHEEFLLFTFSIQKNVLSLMIIALGLMTVGFLCFYFITENFFLVDRHTGTHYGIGF